MRRASLIYLTASARECALSMRVDASFTPMPPVTSFSTPAISCPRWGGRIVASDAKIDQALRELFAAAGSGDAAIGVRGIALPLKAQDGSCYVAHVLPLTSGARRLAGITYSATSALFICKVATQIRSPPEIIARAYNLTPTELRVLMAIVEVGGVPEVAVALGVAESTVKTHLGRLFVKTGTGRQADLVKVVAGFATPLIG